MAAGLLIPADLFGGPGRSLHLCLFSLKFKEATSDSIQGGLKMAQWFEDELFWKELYPYLFSQKTFRQAEEQVDKVLQLAGCQKGAILDLCCGPGRYSVLLAKKGFSVTGVDLSLYLLEKARQNAATAGVAVEWVRSDMRDFVRENTFDLALSLFTSIGYFEEKEDDLKVLGNMFRSLKPGGACLVDINGKERVARQLQPLLGEIMEDGSLIVQRPVVYEDWTRLRNEWIIIEGEKARTFSFSLFVYSGQELKEMLARSGFVNIKLHGSFDGAPYDAEAQRLIATARKP
jgi:SAM-dependent methyltransferase